MLKSNHNSDKNELDFIHGVNHESFHMLISPSIQVPQNNKITFQESRAGSLYLINPAHHVTRPKLISWRGTFAPCYDFFPFPHFRRRLSRNHPSLSWFFSISIKGPIRQSPQESLPSTSPLFLTSDSFFLRLVTCLL